MAIGASFAWAATPTEYAEAPTPESAALYEFDGYLDDEPLDENSAAIDEESDENGAPESTRNFRAPKRTPVTVCTFTTPRRMKRT